MVLFDCMLWTFYSSAFRFGWAYWRRWPWVIATIFFTRVGSTLFDVFVPVAAGRMVDAVSRAGSEGAHAAYVALAIMLGLTAAFQLVRYFNSRLWT